MHYVERLINHFRTTEGDDIAFYFFMGITVLLGIAAAALLVWGLIEWLGVFVVLVPAVVILVLLIIYGIGFIASHIIERIS